MHLGSTIFTCDDCGKRFVAPNIEYLATALSMPMQCPKCGSMHTMPGIMSGVLNFRRSIYQKIWEKADEKGD